MNTLQDLPIEIVQGIIQLIETHDLIALGQLNRWWAAQVYDTCNKRVQELMTQGWTCMVSFHANKNNRGVDAYTTKK
jgi:hypothetical protein